MRLIFGDPAADDLDGLVDYIASDNRQAAENVYRAIVDAATRLKAFPGIGHAGRVAGTRELSVGSLPYIIVYQVSSDTVTVVAVLHTSRNLKRAIRDRRKHI